MLNGACNPTLCPNWDFRILNRFTKDIGYLDEQLPENGLDFIANIFIVASSVAIVCIYQPVIIVVVAPCFLVFVYLRKYYLASSRDIKRIEGTARSPCYAHLGQTFDGLVVLHSCPGAVDAHQKRFEELQDEHLRSWVAFVVTARWLGSRYNDFDIKLNSIFASLRLRPPTPSSPCRGTWSPSRAAR